MINEADGLADIEKWERGAYESVMHKAMHCLEELEAAEIAKGGDQDSGDRVAAPPRFGLAQNSPNPFNPQTTIRLTLPRTMDYSLSIYDVAGRNIRRYAGLAGPGEISVVWDGRNAQGDLQSAGLYFFEARAGEFAEKRKMVLCK